MTKAEHVVALVRELEEDPFADAALHGQLDTLLKRHLNTASSLQMRQFLYNPPPEGCGFPPQYIMEKGRKTNRLATDAATLLTLWRRTKDERLSLILRLVTRRTAVEALGAPWDKDGRIRCSVNIVGTETGRHTAYKSSLGTGFNFHTTTPQQKRMFLADPGCWLAEVDLAGADGWTIGAECAALGDSRMLDDQRAGLKPAQAVALLYQHGAQVNDWTYDRAKAAVPGVKDPPWLYLACKRIIWGSAYGMGPAKMSQQILEDSYTEDADPVWVESKTCQALQRLVFQRYPGIRRRQDRIRMLLSRDGYLECANGTRRQFFGRKTDHATIKEAYGHHPQVVTTWVTSLAWHRMWYDPENRVDERRRRATPKLLRHDSIVFQFRQEDVEWVTRKVRQWFDNPVTIAGTTLTVPWSGGYGPSWGDQTVGVLSPDAR